MLLIQEGLAQVEALAQDNMSEAETKDFMGVMNKLAKIGQNGRLNENGKIVYDIPRGPLVGAPDDYINMGELMKKYDSTAWNKFQSLMEGDMNEKNPENAVTAMKFFISWSQDFQRKHQDIIKEEINSYQKWLKSIE